MYMRAKPTAEYFKSACVWSATVIKHKRARVHDEGRPSVYTKSDLQRLWTNGTTKLAINPVPICVKKYGKTENYSTAAWEELAQFYWCVPFQVRWWTTSVWQSQLQKSRHYLPGSYYNNEKLLDSYMIKNDANLLLRDASGTTFIYDIQPASYGDTPSIRD